MSLTVMPSHPLRLHRMAISVRSKRDTLIPPASIPLPAQLTPLINTTRTKPGNTPYKLTRQRLQVAAAFMHVLVDAGVVGAMERGTGSAVPPATQGITP